MNRIITIGREFGSGGRELGKRLADLLRRKVRTTRAATPYELKNKLIRYGLAQGYDYEAVRDAADALIATTDDSCDTFF